MKFLFNIILFFSLIFVCANSVMANNSSKGFEEVYDIEIGKIDIGTLYFKCFVSDKSYEISINIEDKGLFSGIYKFKGKYSSTGQIKNGLFIPKKYNQFWKTKKKKSVINIVFENSSISSFTMVPKEKELPRVDIVGLENHLDPITSFVSILVGNKRANTVDGRRVYSMNVVNSSVVDEKIYKKIIIDDYKNIWADHKRKNLKHIEVVQGVGLVGEAPLLIKIKLKALSVVLIKN